MGVRAEQMAVSPAGNSTQRAYLDYNATAPLLAEAREALCAAADLAGNASSIHAEGRQARSTIEAARSEVAAMCGVPAEHVTFTSGGTEAANMALLPDATVGGRRQRFDVLLAGAGEHPCVLEGHGFAADAVRSLRLTADGVLDLDDLAVAVAAAQKAGQSFMLALQAANNETGVIQPVREAAALVRAAGGISVCDGVQAAGRIDCGVESLGADLFFCSAHKLGGPKGAGALIRLNPEIDVARALVRGGGQERGRRAGTENVAAIAGFGAAVRVGLERLAGERERLAGLRDAFERGLAAQAPGAVVFGGGAPRLANTCAFAIPGVAAETLLIGLDLEGVSVSSGSACSSGKVRQSHVLDAMGIAPNLAGGAIRASLGHQSRRSDVDRLLAGLEKCLSKVRMRRTNTAA